MRMADDPARPWVSRGAPGRRWTVTIWLIVVTSAAFVIQKIFPAVEQAGAFTIADGIHRWQLWRWASYALLHVSVGHLFFNMLALYFFGPIVENRLKGPRFLAFYCICAIGGAFGYWLLYRVQILDVGSATRLLGASGGILGVVAAAAKIAPDRQIRLLFPPITLRLVTVAWGMFGVALLMISTGGINAGGEAAHLGGLVVGFILIRNPRWLRISTGSQTAAGRKFWKPGDPPEKFFRSDQ